MNDSGKKHKMSKGLRKAIKSSGHKTALDSRCEC